ncbi:MULTISPECIES: murein hydrolase activator EnvC family protein [Microbacterium]|uniref:M23 family metallopeptidase n=1 Tax=Microbacterium profundi TaxID=450380 RepID=A0ABV3LJH1_9MICO|nr:MULTISPECIES: M23 family metallopeptidase [Microbacterium]MCE7482446.1 M23 family metallopeptidase [Microbacterium profundi]
MRAQSSCDRRNFTVPRAIAFLLLLVMLPGAAVGPPTPDPPWTWPVDGARTVTTPFRAPAHEYGPGHRGIDMSAPVGTVVRAPADGVVAFRGVVVDRPLLTLDTGDGLVTTFEPLESTLSPGAVVVAGQEIGTVARGGHTPAGELHLGVRYRDVYINPMLLFGEVPRAILLPCCGPTGVSGTGTGAPDSLRLAGARVGRSL